LEIRGRARRYNLEFLIPEDYQLFRTKEYDETAFELTCPVLYGEMAIQPDGYFKPCLNPPKLFERVSPVFIKGFHIFDLKHKKPSEIPFLGLIKEAKYVNCPNPKCPHMHEVCGVCLVLRYWYQKKEYCVR
jgi:hypothetical protein